MQRDVETLIVGAGPVGLFLAAELRRRGRECMVVDRIAAPGRHSKALAVMPGTLELFGAAGMAQRFVDAGNRIRGMRFVTGRDSAYVEIARLRSPFNFVLILPQWKTQAILEERLRELGVEVCYGHAFRTLQPRGDGYDVDLDTPEGVMRVRARYVAGCDGIGSDVRAAAGIAFDGDTYPYPALLADVRLRSEIPAEEARVHIRSGTVTTMFAMDEELRRVVVIAPRKPLPERADRAWLQAQLAAAGYEAQVLDEPQWSNRFRVHCCVARSMRSGGVFLAGDAVHTHSPVGGQGMNTGLHDAWRLAATLAGDGTPDDYERERLPVARAVVRRTDRLTRALLHPSPLMRAAREWFGPAVLRIKAVQRPVLLALSQLETTV
jgi:2-polyprenyl-6-methoxyphenol hydroxylase-like FAD-dependent oxidoreductase